MKDVFYIKNGSAGKIRLFFLILNNPLQALQAINEFREEQGKLEAELVSLKEKLAEEMFANAKLREELSAQKGNYKLNEPLKPGAEINRQKKGGPERVQLRFAERGEVLDRLGTARNRLAEAFGADEDSWTYGGYRHEAKILSDTYAKNMFDLQMAEYDHAHKEAGFDILDFMTAGLGGASRTGK